MNRRGFMASMLALSVAPAIVRAESLMPVRVRRLTDWEMVMAAIANGTMHKLPVREYLINAPIVLTDSAVITLPPEAAIRRIGGGEIFRVDRPIPFVAMEYLRFYEDRIVGTKRHGTLDD